MSKKSHGFWISYSDLTTGLMVVFLLIMVTMVLFLKHQSSLQKQSVREIVEDTKSSVVTRAELAQELKKAVANINKALDGKYTISVDDVTAELTLPEEFIRFDSNRSTLNPTSITNLNVFLPEYLCALHRFQNTSGKQYNQISNVYINGFADTQGDPIWNAPLSANRAREVVNFTQQMLRCQIEDDVSYSTYTRKILVDQGMEMYDCSTFAADKSEDVQVCEASYPTILQDVELKLKGVGYGESDHCKKLLKHDSSGNCRIFNQEEASERRVTFSVDIVGDDMTDLVSHLISLGAIVGLEEKSIEELKYIHSSILQKCLTDVDVYDGCYSNLLYYAQKECEFTEKESNETCNSIYTHISSETDFRKRFCSSWSKPLSICTQE